MSLEHLALARTDDLPIRHQGAVHSGKVRSVYWLTGLDSIHISQKLNIAEQELAVMVISDKISAYECNWQGKFGLAGVPGKGAALNAISQYWFDQFKEEGIGENHIVAAPHPNVWIVKKAQPILVEAIARDYITGSMWRDYKKGEREFCGISLPDGLKEHQKLDELLLTPTTKGIITGIPGIPEQDDVNITRQIIMQNYKKFGFNSLDDVKTYENMLTQGFGSISRKLDSKGKLLADTKFEFGYVMDENGQLYIIFMDEVGTPDSSRYWSKSAYENGTVVEESKEAFRKILLANLDNDILLNKNRFDERKVLAIDYKISVKDMMDTSDLYKRLATQITGKSLPEVGNARSEIMDALSPYRILDKAA